MIKISNKQLSALKRGSFERFHLRLCDYIFKEYNVQPDRREAIEAGVKTAIDDGQSLGLRGEHALATYGVTAFLVGLDIKNDPKVCAALSSVSLSETKKAEWLVDWLDALQTALETTHHG